MSVHIFGIRHHGPGCARSLRAALEALEPDIVLVEGPPDAEDVLPLVADAGLRPPVALLIYPPQWPALAVYYPFAEFSPEWQALRFAAERGLPARFMDLPQAMRMTPLVQAAEARAKAAEQVETTVPQASASPQPQPQPHPQEVEISEPGAEQDSTPSADQEPTEDGDLHEDPLGMLAEAAGYQDHELWWEHQIEQRQDATGLFQGILEAMTQLRGGRMLHADDAPREAYMRQTIRAAQKEGRERIAVVCGAWHAPALAELGPATPDAAILRARPKTKVTATWIPWTHSRLSFRSGYGAGVRSPGWYHHLWTAPDRSTVRWATHVARLLRAEGLDASSASVIETVRLADALAAMRELPLPGLAELNDAVQTVLCAGDAAPMSLIRQRLEIGELLGEVPASAPAVPLARDLEDKQRRLRLKVSPAIVTLDLDLREANDLARSRLLHQLLLLDVPWGQSQRSTGRKSGTFHEYWQLQWQVDFSVKIIEANIWGNTVERAATAAVSHAAEKARDLVQVSELLDGVILAALPEAIDRVLAQVQSLAAIAADVRRLMDALPALARVARYGDVRQTRAEQILPVVDGMFERIAIGLAPACASLDEDSARQMIDSIGRVQESIDLVDLATARPIWQDLLRKLSDRDGIHALVRGWCVRLLLDQGLIEFEELERQARLMLSHATEAVQAAAWIEGLLRGSGLVLMHQDALWRALDRWITGLTGEAFVEMLPLLRRAFSSLEPPVRRTLGEKLKHFDGSQDAPAPAAASSRPELDHGRAQRVLSVLAHILGATHGGT